MSEKLETLKSKLRQIFQLDQSDLDFGIYKIMNEKNAEITDFLDNKLLAQVKESFKDIADQDKLSYKKELDDTISKIESLGMNPDDSPRVKELKALISNSIDVNALENDVYSHLTTFFSRYYDGGDFMSLRRYKKDAYAIPYEGEEVKLHWANADQYYIKTSENFKDYTFFIGSDEEGNKKTVHFKLVEAETEKDNNKAEKDKVRRFMLVEENPIEIVDDELVIKFVFTIDENKKDQNKIHNVKTLSIILPELEKEEYSAYSELSTLVPTEKNKNRTLLEKHLTDYTAKNSFDYFIHKDLKGFLDRELDFYIKNEVLNLDDLDDDNIKKSLSKAKAIKNIAKKINTFLGQLEDFQKKLWLKKKFVVETNYCITLDKVDEKFYSEIINNKAQIEEWENLFSISEIGGNVLSENDDNKKLEFLKQNQFLQLDTKFFSSEFKYKLLSTIDNLDEQTNGLLINSDNFHALNLLQEKYKEQVKCIYIDPPYNTGNDGFIYKDGYKHSTWLSMINSRLQLAKQILDNDGIVFISIDDNEITNLKHLCDYALGQENYEADFYLKVRHEDRILREDIRYQLVIEHALCYKKKSYTPNRRVKTKSSDEDYKFDIEIIAEPKETTTIGDYVVEIYDKQSYKLIKKNPGEGCLKEYQIRGSLISQSGSASEYYELFLRQRKEKDKEGALYKVIGMGIKGDGIGYRLIRQPNDYSFKNGFYYQGRPLTNTQNKGLPYANFYDFTAETNQVGFEGGVNFKNGKKPIALLEQLFEIAKITDTTNKNSLIVDFFAGSGSTGNAIIDLNRNDKGNRQYILVEMGKYFNTVTKPRIQKVAYSKDWKDEKPVDRDGVSQIIKYMSLESYEDACNNLVKKGSQIALSNELEEQYMLNYMFDIEYADSLLNISMFKNPFDYKMKITQNNETKLVNIDLIETFNYLIGLNVETMYQRDGFLIVQGKNLKEESILVIWRNTEEKSNEDLNNFLQKRNINATDFEFNTIYVNGDNNIKNLPLENGDFKVTLIEEEFKKRMFDMKEV